MKGRQIGFQLFQGNHMAPGVVAAVIFSRLQVQSHLQPFGQTKARGDLVQLLFGFGKIFNAGIISHFDPLGSYFDMNQGNHQGPVITKRTSSKRTSPV